MKLFAFLIIGAATLLAQEGSPIRISPAPVAEAYTVITHYTSNNPDYICKARSTQDISTITVSAITAANPGVMTAAAHGMFFQSGVTAQKFVVFISGLTGNWTPLNGFHVLATASTSTLTTDVDTTTFGAVTGTIVVSTRAPKATAKVWSVYSIAYDASNNPTGQAWSVPTAGTTITDLRGGQTSFSFACTAPAAFQ
jgi:hypothetical protein